jgi:hypothetical protein
MRGKNLDISPGVGQKIWFKTVYGGKKRCLVAAFLNLGHIEDFHFDFRVHPVKPVHQIANSYRKDRTYWKPNEENPFQNSWRKRGMMIILNIQVEDGERSG